MFRTILVPLDGSPLAELALPFALSIAAKCNATVHVALIHVPGAYSDYMVDHATDLDREAKDREQGYLDALRAKLGKVFHGKFELHHLEGIVPETLAEEVVERGVDLVVMNAHGWGYTSRALLGSVSDYLMRHLDVPLLVMHSQAMNSELDRTVSFRRILVPLDGSELAESILKPAERLGGLWNAEYRLVRVVSPPLHLLGSIGEVSHGHHEAIVDVTKKQVGGYLETVADGMRKHTLAVQASVPVSRNTAWAILEEASSTGCDLIAISTRARGGLPRLLLGSVADKVIRGAHTPVLVYHPHEHAR